MPQNRYTPEQLAGARYSSNTETSVQYLKTIGPDELRTHDVDIYGRTYSHIFDACHGCGAARTVEKTTSKAVGRVINHSELQLHVFIIQYARELYREQEYKFCDLCIKPCCVSDNPDGQRVLILRGRGVSIRHYTQRIDYPNRYRMTHREAALQAVYDERGDLRPGFTDCIRCCCVTAQPEIFRPLPHSDRQACPECYSYVEQEMKVLIKPYHSNSVRQIPITKGWSLRRRGLHFGVELEVETTRNGRTTAESCSDCGGAGYRRDDPDDDDTYDCPACDGSGRTNGADLRNEVAQYVLNALYAAPGPLEREVKKGLSVIRFEEDGSLDNGFEIISLPLGLPEHRHLWNTILSDKTVRKNVISHQTETCGLHIHVSRSALTNLQIARMNCFINDPANEHLIRAIARRYNSSFAQVSPKHLATAHERSDKYQMLNTGPDKTIEFRMFRGSCNPDAVVAALEFTNALVQYTSESIPVFTQPDDAATFLNFLNHQKMRRETVTLRQYLKERGIVWTKNTWGRMRQKGEPSGER